MAHQAHAIPWQTLADNLKYMHCSPRNHGVTNLYLRKTKSKNQVKELKYFVKGFVRALEEYSMIERKKYEENPTEPEADEIIISDTAVKKMAKTVLRYKASGSDWSASHEFDDAAALETLSSLDDILSPYERSAKRFIRDTELGEGDMFDSAQEACEQTKTMLMYGEMDALFKLAAHPEVRFYRLWHEDMYANSHGFGLYKLMDAALQAYICLNIIFLKPALYDFASLQSFLAKENEKKWESLGRRAYDYRLTAAYQYMLLRCTGMPYGYMCDTHTYPHREFFGIPRGMFRFEYDDTQYGRWQKRNLGTQNVLELACDTFRGVHIPSKSEIPLVLSLLGKKGLPTEIALQVVDMAGYVSVGRLPVRDDPLHKENVEELKKYLSYCWKLLVRVDMLCKAGVHGKSLDWEAEAMDALHALFDMPGRSVFESVPCEEGDFSRRSRRRMFTTQKPGTEDNV